MNCPRCGAPTVGDKLTCGCLTIVQKQLANMQARAVSKSDQAWAAFIGLREEVKAAVEATEGTTDRNIQLLRMAACSAIAHSYIMDKE